MSKGLELASIRCLLGIDNDKTALRTFSRNHKHAEAIVGDLREISTDMILDSLNRSIMLFRYKRHSLFAEENDSKMID